MDDVEEMGVATGEGTIGEEDINEDTIGEEVTSEEVIREELMVDALKELTPKEGVASSIIEGATLGGIQRVKEALTTQVPSIDTLLGDIYELRY